MCGIRSADPRRPPYHLNNDTAHMKKPDSEYPRTESGHADWKQIHHDLRTGKKKSYRFLSREVYFDPRVRALDYMVREVFYYGLQQVSWNTKKGKGKATVATTTVYFPCEALKQIGIHKDSRRRALATLIKAGLIERMPKPDDNNHKPKVYRMLVY